MLYNGLNETNNTEQDEMKANKTKTVTLAIYKRGADTFAGELIAKFTGTKDECLVKASEQFPGVGFVWEWLK